MDMEEYLSIGKAAKILGITPKTLRRWEEATVIQSERTRSGYRRYRSDAVMRLLTKRPMGFGTRCVIYARVSSAKASHDGYLDRQRDRLLAEAQRRGYDPVLVERGSMPGRKPRPGRRPAGSWILPRPTAARSSCLRLWPV
jgi:putative resolvase